jgi:outer membrane protein assembly factor BamB
VYDGPTGKVYWRERIGGEDLRSPIRAGDRLYCTSRSGEVVVLAAANQFELLGRIKLGERSNSTPAVVGGVMYLRTVSHLMALDSK